MAISRSGGTAMTLVPRAAASGAAEALARSRSLAYTASMGSSERLSPSAVTWASPTGESAMSVWPKKRPSAAWSTSP